MHITYVIIIIEYANPVGFINTVVILLHMVLEGTPVLSTIAFFSGRTTALPQIIHRNVIHLSYPCQCPICPT